MASLPDYFDRIEKMPDPGAEFEAFVGQLFQAEYPGLRGFPPGKDGGVDLLHRSAEGLTAFQTKALSSQPKSAWVKGIQSLCSSYDKGKPQEQSRIWERQDPPIRRYVYCVSCRFLHAQERQDLEATLKQTFRTLAGHESLQHLAELEVEIFDRDELRQRLLRQPNLALLYNGSLPGLELLDQPKYAATGLRRFLMPPI